jgi:outer membrane lipoprotein SlyB
VIQKLLWVLLAGAAVASSLACAAKRHVLYPNTQLEAVGAAAAQQDVDDCIQKAAAAGYASNSGEKVVGSTVVGAAAGAAVGAVAGGAGTGAAMGAAGGGTGGLIRGIFGSRNLDPEQRQFIDQCLKEKGYEVINWQ